MKIKVVLILVFAVILCLSCSKDNDDDKHPSGGIKTAGVVDDDDRLLDQEEDLGDDDEYWVEAEPVEYSGAGEISQAVRSANTYGLRNGGRQAFRIFPMLRSGTGIVVFSDRPRQGYRVQLGYANRINSGPHRGFVVKNSRDRSNTFVHSPYGRHPSRVSIYY